MEETGYNFIDYIVIAITLISMLFALMRGFLGSFLSLVGWILSIYLTYVTYPGVAPFLASKIKNELILLVCGHSILLIGYLIVFGIFNILATNALKGLSRGAFDRLLGLGFGFVRGMLLVSFCYYIAASSISLMNGTMNNDKSASKDNKNDDSAVPSFISQAKTYPYLKMGKEVIEEFIPAEFNDKIQEAYGQIVKKTTDEVFVEGITKKLEETLSDEQKKKLQEMLDDAALTKSDKELDDLKAKELMKIHKENQAKAPQNKASDKQNTVSDSDLNQLEKALKSQPQEEDTLHFDENDSN